jgi:hypothetical protein
MRLSLDEKEFRRNDFGNSRGKDASDASRSLSFPLLFKGNRAAFDFGLHATNLLFQDFEADLANL